MIEINPKDCKKMWVWDKNQSEKVKRIVIAKIGKEYLVVHPDTEKDFYNDDYFDVVPWKYAAPIKEKKLTAVVKSAEEIIGIKGAVEFEIGLESELDSINYTSTMNELAGHRIEIKKIDNYIYEKIAYKGAGHMWLKDWLKDFREEEL